MTFPVLPAQRQAGCTWDDQTNLSPLQFSMSCFALAMLPLTQKIDLTSPLPPNSLCHQPSCIQKNEIILNAFLTPFLYCHFHIYNYPFMKG